MNILIIPSWYPATPHDINGSFFREQAIALKRAGLHVGVIYPQLISLRNWSSLLRAGQTLRSQVDEGVPTYRSPRMNLFPRIPRGIDFLWRNNGLRLFDHYCKKHGRPDLIHVHSMLHAGSLAYEIKARSGVPFVVTEHSTAFARGLLSKWQLQQCRRIAKAAERRFAVSKEFASLLESTLSLDGHPWEFIPNMVNQDFLSCSLGQPDAESYRFINVGIVSDKKRQANIVQAFAKAFSSNENVFLTIGGSGPSFEALQEICYELGLQSRVSLPGMLSRAAVLNEMAASDAFVLASKYETFGVVLVEALALGKPVIATKCGGPESIVQSGDGLLVPVDDIESLSMAMRSLYENRHCYEPARIRESCKARYGEQAVLKQIIAAYDETLNSQCA